MGWEMAVQEAWKRLQKFEAITENTLRKYGRVSEDLASKLQSARVDYAVAKDNRSDPYMRDEGESSQRHRIPRKRAPAPVKRSGKRATNPSEERK